MLAFAFVKAIRNAERVHDLFLRVVEERKRTWTAALGVHLNVLHVCLGDLS